jgi:hypothetical protein
MRKKDNLVGGFFPSAHLPSLLMLFAKILLSQKSGSKKIDKEI